MWCRGASSNYVRPSESQPQHHGPEHQYEVIQLDHTQHDAAAAAVHYETLDPQTLGQPHLYDAIARRHTTGDAADYVNVAQCKN